MISRVLACAAVLFVVLLALAFAVAALGKGAAAGAAVTASDVILALRDMILTSVFTVLAARSSSATWSWGRTAGTFFGVYVALSVFWFLIGQAIRLAS